MYKFLQGIRFLRALIHDKTLSRPLFFNYIRSSLFNLLKLSLYRIAILFLFVGFLSACKSDPSGPQKPLMERNEEVRTYIHVLDDLVNEFCELMQTTVDKAAEIDEKEKNGEETTFMDGLEMIGGMASSAMKIKKLSDEIEEMEDQQKDFEESLSASDYKEFIKLYNETTSCFYDLAKKSEVLED